MTNCGLGNAAEQEASNPTVSMSSHDHQIVTLTVQLIVYHLGRRTILVDEAHRAASMTVALTHGMAESLDAMNKRVVDLGHGPFCWVSIIHSVGARRVLPGVQQVDLSTGPGLTYGPLQGVFAQG